MKPKIIAHRGHTKHHPENTLSAFQAALDAGTDAIELDVHMTRDGVLVVHHDFYLGQPDNGEGKIHEKDFAYIQSLRINKTEHIPTLEEVFQKIGNQLQYEIELKGFSELFIEKVAALVEKYSITDRIEFTSPHPYVLTHLKQLLPHVKVGRFVAPLLEWMDAQLGQAFAINDAFLGKIDALHCPIELIDRQFVQDAQSNGLLIHLANCDTDEMLQIALEAEVDQISTNELELIIEKISQLRA